MGAWLRVVTYILTGRDTGGAMPAALRTLTEIEVDLEDARHRQARAPKRRRPDDVTLLDVEVNALLEEWARAKALVPGLEVPLSA